MRSSSQSFGETWLKLIISSNISPLAFSNNSSRSSSRNLGKLFFHSVSRLKRVALKESACCSTVSRTIFQKHSDTARLRLRVVTCPVIIMPFLKRREVWKNCSSYSLMAWMESSFFPRPVTTAKYPNAFIGNSCPASIFFILSGLVRFSSARSTLVRTSIVRFPWGSIWATKSVTLLLSASTDPSWMHRIIAFGLDMCACDICLIDSLVSLAISEVTVLMIPGRSTSTIRCRPGPFTDIEITSVLTVWPPRTLFFIRISTSLRSSARSDSFVKSNSLELSRNCAMW